MWLRSISSPLLSLKCNANVSKNREGMQRKFWRRFVVEGPPGKAASLLRRERVAVRRNARKALPDMALRAAILGLRQFFVMDDWQETPSDAVLPGYYRRPTGDR
jgi:hypothetical protein